jgi:hypothetical protein
MEEKPFDHLREQTKVLLVNGDSTFPTTSITLMVKSHHTIANI